MVVNPKKRKHSKKSKGRSHRSTSYHSNPSRKGSRKGRRRRVHRNPAGQVMGVPVMAVGAGALGGLADVIAVNFASKYLPTQLQSGIGKFAMKLAGVLAIALVGGKVFGREVGKMAAIGAGSVVLVDGAREFLAPYVPGLSDLMDSPFISQDELSGLLGVGGLNGGAAPSGTFGAQELAGLELQPAWE